MQLAGCSNPLTPFLPSCFLYFIFWNAGNIDKHRGMGLNLMMTASFDRDAGPQELEDRTRHLSKEYIHLIHTHTHTRARGWRDHRPQLRRKSFALPTCLGLYSNLMGRVPESQTNREAPIPGPSLEAVLRRACQHGTGG